MSKSLKRILSFVLVFAMVFGMFGQSALAMSAETGETEKEIVDETETEVETKTEVESETVLPNETESETETETETAAVMAADKAVTYEFGSAKTVLKPGKYDIPVSLNKAGAEGQSSMAAACVKSGVIEVAEDGTAKMTLTMGAVSVGAISGWGSEWKIYTENSFENEQALKACEFTTNAQGEAETITFTIPNNTWDGVYTHMHIEVMSLDQDAYFKIDYAKATPYAEPVPVHFTAGENGNLEAAVDGQIINSGDMVKSGKTVTFTATPNKGFEVDQWTGVEASGKVVSVVVEKALDVNVTFAEKVYKTFAVNFAAGENGTIEAAVDGKAIKSGDEVVEGSTVVFTAKPAEGYKVTEWIGVTGTENTASAYVNSILDIKVNFGLKLDRTELDQVIAEGDAMVEDAWNYADDRNWDDFVFELGEAKNADVYENQGLIDKEVRALKRRMGYVVKLDKTALQEQVDRAKNDNYFAYPVKVSEPVRTLCNAANKHLERWQNTRAESQEELDKITSDLSKEIDTLEAYVATVENTVELVHEDGTTTAYKTFVEAYKAYADTDKEIKLTKDIEMNSVIDRRGDMDSNGSVNVNLNGFTLNNNGNTICMNTLTGDKGGVLNSNVKFFSDMTLGANITVNGFVHVNGNLVVDGATITAEETAINGDSYFELQSVVINSGNITSKNGYAVEGYAIKSWMGNTYAPVTINDGTFVGKTFAIAGSGVITINGGKFKAANGALMGAAPVLPEGQKLSTVADAEGFFKLVPVDTVEKGEVVASVAGKDYVSINEAFANVKAGETVKLLKDVTVYSAINVNVNCTLDVNGHVFNVYAYNQNQDFEQEGGEAGGWSAVVVNKDAMLDIVDHSTEKTGKLSVVNNSETHTAGFVSYGTMTVTDLIVENMTPDYEEDGDVESSAMMPYKGGKVILDNVKLSEQNKGSITETGNEYGEVIIKNTTAVFDSQWDTLLCGSDSGAGSFAIENCNFTDHSVRDKHYPDKLTRVPHLNFRMKDSTWNFTKDGGIMIQGFEKNNHPVIENSTITTNGNKAVEVEGVDDIKFINNTIKAPNGYAIVTKDNIMRDYRIVSGTYEGKDYAVKCAPLINIDGGKFKAEKDAVDGIAVVPDGQYLKKGDNGYFELAEGELPMFAPAEGKDFAIYAENGELLGGVNFTDNSNVPFVMVPTNGKVVMQKDITVTNNTYFNKLNGGEYTLDLNGHTLDINEDAQLVLGNRVQVTVIDSQDKGVVNSAASKVFTQFDGTALTIKGGTWNIESITSSHNNPANFEGGHFNLRTGGNSIIYYNEYMAPYCNSAVITGGDYNFDVTQQYIQTLALPGRPIKVTVEGESQLKKDTHATYVKDGRWYVVAKEDLPAPETPIVTPESKNVKAGETVEVSIAEVKDAKVYYSTDGSIPTSTRGTLYEKPFTVDKTTTVKAIAISDVNGKLSTVAEAVYTFVTPDTALLEKAKAESKKDIYTDESLKALNAAIESAQKVFNNKDAAADDIAKANAELDAAVKALAVKPADYSKVDAALKTIPEDLSNYTEATVKAVTEAKDAVVRDLDITKQGEVDAMAEAIEKAVKALTLKPADYSKVDAALKTIPEDLSNYTDETAKAVTEAKDAVVRDLDITKQSEVDAMAEAIEKAVKALEVKDLVKAFVERLYTEVLGREAEENGLNEWTEVLKSKKETGAKVAMGFVDSDEFKKKDMTDEAFLQIMYRTFLGRKADDKGLAEWKKVLDEGMSRMFVFRGFVESDEFTKICESYNIVRGNVDLKAPMDQRENEDTTKFVARLYKVFLGRKADADGINGWVSQLVSKANNAKQAARGFVMSDEFQGKDLSNEEYVKTIYIGILNREADPEGLADWVKVLENGGSRLDIFNGFADSPEFRELADHYGLANDWKAN